MTIKNKTELQANLMLVMNYLTDTIDRNPNTSTENFSKMVKAIADATSIISQL